MASRALFAILAIVAAVASASAFELKKTPMHKPHRDNKPIKNSDERLTKENVRRIARGEEIAIAAASKTNIGLPASPSDDDNKNATYRSAEIALLINQEGVRVNLNANADGAYRDIPTTMCSASAIGASTASNQAAFVTSHNTYRSQVNSCKYKLPKPHPALANTISSKAMATQANSWAQHLKSTDNCGLVHSSATQRTVSFKLDNGTAVTKAYTGENLAQISVCVALSDTVRFNALQAQYCSNGYIYKLSADLWFAEQTAYSNANNGNFATQAQLNAGLFSKVGHFTQVIWASSRVIAGGAAECSSLGTPQTWSCSPPGSTVPGHGTCPSSGTLQVPTRCFTWVVAGRYLEGGNYPNRNPYSSSGICSPPFG